MTVDEGQVWTDELKAQLEDHDSIKIIDEGKVEWFITHVSYDGELNAVVVEIAK